MAKLNKWIEKHLNKSVLATVALGAFNFGGQAFELLTGIDSESINFHQLLQSSTGIQTFILMVIYVYLKNQKK